MSLLVASVFKKWSVDTFFCLIGQTASTLTVPGRGSMVQANRWGGVSKMMKPSEIWPIKQLKTVTTNMDYLKKKTLVESVAFILELGFVFVCTFMWNPTGLSVDSILQYVAYLKTGFVFVRNFM